MIQNGEKCDIQIRTKGNLNTTKTTTANVSFSGGPLPQSAHYTGTGYSVQEEINRSDHANRAVGKTHAGAHRARRGAVQYAIQSNDAKPVGPPSLCTVFENNKRIRAHNGSLRSPTAEATRLAITPESLRGLRRTSAGGSCAFPGKSSCTRFLFASSRSYAENPLSRRRQCCQCGTCCASSSVWPHRQRRVAFGGAYGSSRSKYQRIDIDGA